MDIIKFEYIYNEYATTNPPRSISTSYTLEGFTDSSVTLRYYTYHNGDENELKFTITNPEYGEISGLFQRDKIVEAIEKQCKTGQNKPPIDMSMCGGSVSRGINLTKASGEELQTTNMPDEANALLKYLNELVKANSKPESDSWSCPVCGAQNDGGNFCTNCGNRRIHIMKG